MGGGVAALPPGAQPLRRDSQLGNLFLSRG